MATGSSRSPDCDQCGELFCHHRNVTDDERNNMVTCGLCEVGERAEGRCEQCNEYLCDGCIIRHIKLKVTSEHRIIPLEDFKELRDSEIIQRRQRTYSLRAIKDQADSVVCRRHRGEAMKFFCDDCKVTICRDCILTSHKNHIAIDIEDAAEQIRQDLVRVVGDIKLRRLHISQDWEILDEYKKTIDGQFGSISDIVRQTYQEMSTRLNESYSELNHKLSRLQAGEYKRVEAQAAELEKKVEEADSLIRSSEKRILSATSMEILQSKDKLQNSLYQHLFDFENDQPLGKAEFFVLQNRKYSSNASENLIGDISVAILKSPNLDSSPCSIHKINLKRECIFNIWETRNNHPSVKGIVEADGVIWVATSRSLVRIGMETFKRTNVQLTSTSDIMGIATGPGGKLLVGFSRGNSLKIFYKEIWNNFATVADSISHLSTSRDSQKVYVTMGGHRGDTQKIAVYGTDGKMKQHLILPYELRITKTSISCLTTNPAGQICICDNSKSRILFFNDNLEIINQYLGPEGQLSPRGIIFDCNGYALVADDNRNNVQIVTEDGIFLMNLLNREHFQDIGAPVAIATDHNGRLWVGTDMGIVCCYSY